MLFPEQTTYYLPASPQDPGDASAPGERSHPAFTSKLRATAAEWIPSSAPTQPPATPNPCTPDTEIGYLNSRGLDTISRKGNTFVHENQLTSDAITIESFLNYLLSFPEETRKVIPPYYLEKAAILTSNSAYMFDSYDIAELARLFHLLDYKPQFLIDALVRAAHEKIPSARSRQLAYMLRTFALLCDYSKETDLFDKLSKYILLNLNKFDASDLMDITYFLKKRAEDYPHLVERAVKTMIDLINNDLQNKNVETSEADNPIYLQITPKMTIDILQFFVS